MLSVSSEEGRYELAFDWVMPNAVRAGRICTVSATLKNVGNLSLVNPMVTISDSNATDDEAMEFSLDGENWYKGFMQFIALNTDGNFNGYMVGEETTVHLLARIPSTSSGNVGISMRANTTTDNMASAKTEMSRYLSPATLAMLKASSDTETVEYATRLEKVYGANNGEMIENLVKAARYTQGKSGEVVQNAAELVRSASIIGATIGFGSVGSFVVPYLIPELGPYIPGSGDTFVVRVHRWDGNDWEVLSENLSGKDDIVIISHGLMNSYTDSWLRQMAEALEGKHDEILTIEWNASQGGIRYTSGKVVEILKLFGVDKHFDKATLIGHSYGSHL